MEYSLIIHIIGGVVFAFLVWLGTKGGWLSSLSHWFTSPTTEMYKERIDKKEPVTDFPLWAVPLVGIVFGLISFFISNL